MVQRSNDHDALGIRDRSPPEWHLAKQRASVKWLVAKAYSYQVPANLRDPFYRDANDGVERLKPQIVHSLANAELYCSCLASIYADPNYHNLSHWGVIQALARKGVYVAEPSDVALTETVLIQTGPIKMSAHMAVMEAIQALYIKELITAERVVGVVRRFTQLQPSSELPADQEEALLLWINKACGRLRAQMAAECRTEDGGVPSFPLQQDISDLSDGTCLAGLVALYCPDELSWPEVAFSDPPRIADSLYNLQLLEKFCRDALPYNPHFLTLEDILYMHSSVKQNVLVLLADLFYLFEISPAKCVRQPVLAKERPIEAPPQGGLYSVRRSQPELRGSHGGDAPSTAAYSAAGARSHALSEPSVVLRRTRGSRSADRGRQQRFSMFEAAGRDSPSGQSGGSQRRPQSMYHPIQLAADERSPYRDDDRSNSEESEFVVQRASGPLTLSRLVQQRHSSSPPGSVHSDEAAHGSARRLKERMNRDTKWEERGEDRRGTMSECGDLERYERAPAGKPSPRGPGSVTLSRRNSFTDDSQLTVENFGGSQDNLQLLGRNPDKQPVVHRGRRESSAHRDLLKESAIDFGDRDPFQDAEQERALSRSQSRQSLYDRSESRQERPPSRNLFESSSIKDHFRPLPARGSRDDVASEPGGGGGGGRGFRPIGRDSESDGVVDIDNRVLDALEREARGQSPSKASPGGGGGGGNNLVIMFDNNDDHRPTSSFAELKTAPGEHVSPAGSGINIVYMQHEKEDRGKGVSPPRQNVYRNGGAARSNGGPPPGGTTSWVQQQQSQRHGLTGPEGGSEPALMASELHSIKLRLEEKRRNIEKEKRKMELAMNRQKQSVGKQAFLQAMGQDMSQQNLHQMKEKWDRRADAATPDLENMDYDQYTNSLQSMNESLSELQDDIQRLSQQQSQMQQMQMQQQPPMQHQMQQMQHLMQNGGQTQAPYRQAYPAPAPQYGGGRYPGAAPPPADPSGQFYLHAEPPQVAPPPRRQQWAQMAPLAPEEMYGQMAHMSPHRARWGQPVRPMMGGGYPAAPPDPYQGYSPHHAPQQMAPQRPFMLHQDPAGYGVVSPPHGMYPSPQHHRLDGGMMGASPYHPDYPGYQTSPGPGAGAPVASQPGFRLHGSPAAADAEPRELRAGQSPRMYSDYQSGREERASPRVPTVRRSAPRRRSPSPRGGAAAAGGVLHAPMPAPPIDDMAPQNVSFIGDGEDQESSEVREPTGAGSRTYRVPRHSTGEDRPDRAAPPPPEPTSPSRATPPRPRLTPTSGNKTFKVRGSQSPQSPSWASRRAGSQSPLAGRTAAAPEPPPPEDEASPEVLAAMKVDKIKADADPEMGFVISFDDNAAPRKPKPRLGARRTPAKTSLTDHRRPEIPPKPSSLSLAGGERSAAAGGPPAGLPSAFSTYTKWPRASRSDTVTVDPTVAPPAAGRRSLSRSPSPPTPGGGGLSLGRLSDPRKRTARPTSATSPADGAASPAGDQPLMEKLDVDPSLPPEAMRPLKPTHQGNSGVGLVIGDQLAEPDSEALDEMERKKERILMLSIKRKQQQEAARIKKEEEALRRKQEEERKEEEKARKKEEERIRKERIFEAYKLKKAMEEAEKNGTPMPQQAAPAKPAVRPRPKSTPSKPRPKSMMDPAGQGAPPAAGGRGPRGSGSNLHAMSDKQREPGEPAQWGSNSSLSGGPRSRRGSNASLYGESAGRYSRPVTAHSGRKATAREGAGGAAPPGGMRKDGPHRTSTGSLSSAGRRMGARVGSSGSLCDDDSGSGYGRRTLTHSGRRTSGPGSGGTPRYSETDSGLGRDTPTRRGVSPGAYSRGVASPTGPGSLPPGLVSRRRNQGDDASDTSSMASYDYNGPRLFKQPTTKSNRSIMLNAVEYCVFPGAVNREAKQRVLEEIARTEARHFLILFRDARCQFRALYWYEPETDEVVKLYGTGPKVATDKMFDKFFKYNSGGKTFNQIHTKSLSVTIDAFTIHDALWQGKRPSLPSKKDLTLVT